MRIILTDGEYRVARDDYTTNLTKERAERKRKRLQRKEAMATDYAAKLEGIRANMDKAIQDFESRFDWEDRKAMMAARYWTEAHQYAVSNDSLCFKGSDVHEASKAAFVSESCVKNWSCNWASNGGKFSASEWGSNWKVAGRLADVETKHWMREWVIKNMGHKRGKKNAKNPQFNKAIHDHLGLAYDPENLVISLSSSLKALNNDVGACCMPVKKGSIHHDNHGADHVQLNQKPKFLDLYRQIYNRGPNFVVVNGKYIDKDRIPDLMASKLLEDEACIGHRGVNLGGRVDPSRSNTLLPFIKTDHNNKTWHIGCHDECCVYALEDEREAWFIPGIDMGDMPTKSHGDIEALAQMDNEFGAGCITLSGAVGQTHIKDMSSYIRDRHDGKDCLVPHFSSVRMYAGQGEGKDGTWAGKESLEHIEMIVDQFDVTFNLVHRIPDPKLATAQDILKITEDEIAAFAHGLCIQVDRSQSHLSRPKDGLNTKNGKGINKKAGGAQPHFRHTFAPLLCDKDGNQYTDWRQCRSCLCEPGCAICQAAVDKYGNFPTFQSCGRKGSNRLLNEIGVDTKGMLGPAQAIRLNEEPNWGQMKSAMQEMLESRGHFLLIGAAYHPELAYKELGWARLKAKVKPYVDGTIVKLRQLIADAMQSIGQKERLEDARRCRGHMWAYRKLAEEGLPATGDNLKLWTKEHKKHRGLHPTELTDLQQTVGMVVAPPSAASVERLRSATENKKITDILESQLVRRKKYFKNRERNRKYREKDIVATLANEKARSKKHKSQFEKYKFKRNVKYKRNTSVLSTYSIVEVIAFSMFVLL